VPEVVASHYVLLTVPARETGLSRVRKAVDQRDGSAVAVKYIKARNDRLTEKLFNLESKTLRKLDHPNIVTFRDGGVAEDGEYFIVLDWVDRSLTDVLADGPWDSWDTVWRDFGRPLLQALAHAHLLEIEHRDIKPSNVLIDPSGAPLLADFGIAKIRGEDQPQPEMTVQGFRSGPYAPPEMDAKLPYVRDVYSVGVLLVQCLSTRKILDFPDIAPALEGVSIPPSIRKVLEACLSTEPSDRPRNASELLATLDAASKHRAAMRAADRRVIWLRLTNAAVTGLIAGELDRPKANARLQADLAGEVHASFKYDRENNEHDRKTLILAGKQFRYMIKLDDDGAGGVVTAVVEPDFDQLEGLRRRSCTIPPGYGWTPHEPGDRDQAKRSLAELIGLIDDHIEEDRERGRAKAVPVEGDDLFELWLKILDAREELARGERKPMAYKECRVTGRRATFTLTEPTEVNLVGTEWKVEDVQAGRYFGWGEVIDHEGETITLVGSRFDKVPSKASLVPHIGPSEAALTRQRNAVMAVKDGTGVRPDLRGLLLDPATNAEPMGVPISNWELKLDQSKKDAVEDAISAADILLVQGPPGTGKTSFIAETVLQTLRANPGARVLIASQTHVAVDNALERIDKTGIHGLVRLAGVDSSRVDENVQHLLLKEQTRRWADRVRTRAEASIAAQAKAEGIEPHHLRAALLLEQVHAASEQIAALEAHVRAGDNSKDTPSELSTALEAVDEPDDSLQDRLDNLIEYRKDLVSKAQVELRGDLTLPSTPSIEDARSAVELLVGQAQNGHQLLDRLRIQADWLQRMASDDTLDSVYLATTSVVAGTCTGFLRNKAVKVLEFDLCIVDEASKATLTEVMVPLSRARKWILVGDTNQLPPTDEDLLRRRDILDERELTPEHIKETLFQRLADQLPSHSQRMLRTQYRMVRPIGDLISTCFYNGELQSAREDGLEGLDRVFGRPVMWLDTTPLGEERRESAPGGHGTSLANRAEARLIVEQLKTLDAAIGHRLVKPETDAPLDVLVISPYRSQVEDLRRRIAPLTPKHLKIAVMSVDSVQGREADIAFFSVTRSNTDRGLGFIGADYWRRINVALSRARFGLMIVGDRSFIQSSTGALRKVLDHIVQNPDDCEMRLASRD
jgi:hypothetical protein